MGQKLGGMIGNVFDAGIFEMPDQKGTLVKALVEMEVDKPLMQGINAGSKKDGIFWVDFRFEKLPQFCYHCGLVGHEEKMCLDLAEGVTQEDEDPKGWGPWLRAFAGGWRIRHQKQNRDGMEEGSNEQPRHSNYTKVVQSETLLTRLAELTVNEGSSGKDLHLADDGVRNNRTDNNEREGNTTDTSNGKNDGGDDSIVSEAGREARNGVQTSSQTQENEKLGGAGKNNNAQERGSQRKALVDISNKGGNVQKENAQKKWKRLGKDREKSEGKENCKDAIIEGKKRNHDATDMEIDSMVETMKKRALLLDSDMAGAAGQPCQEQ